MAVAAGITASAVAVEAGYRVVRRSVLVAVLGPILAVPVLLFLCKEELGLTETSTLYRREFVTLVALDVAVTQHFFILLGYASVGALLVLSGALLGGDPLAFLFSWMTLSPVAGRFHHGLLSLLLGAYGMVGIALQASLILNTYDRIVREFPQTKRDLENYTYSVVLEESDAAEEVPRDEFDADDMDERVKAEYVTSMVGDSIEDVIEKEYLGNPTFSRLWNRMRSRSWSPRRYWPNGS